MREVKAMRACIKKETQVIYSGVGQVYFSVRLLQLCCHDKAQQIFTFDSDVCIFFYNSVKAGIKTKKTNLRLTQCAETLSGAESHSFYLCGPQEELN